MMWDQRYSGGTSVGEKIGSFRIESWLGAGSLAIVYRGTNEETGKPAAIKVARAGREIFRRRLWQSGEILRELRHENIVRFLGLGRFREAAYLAMELLPGRTLSSVVEDRGALPWPEVAALGLQICDALHYLHEHDFLHRNLKPSHFILNEQGRLKLIGFGLARSLYTTTIARTGLAIGTPGYMAPEQICGAAQSTSVPISTLSESCSGPCLRGSSPTRNRVSRRRREVERLWRLCSSRSRHRDQARKLNRSPNNSTT